ncbi:MAG: menaquinone biosynthesis protein [Cyanobacteria bacterium HKST-UBA03]|nr:menaquinone biosynthesis protein [Cyanobacteria bacterium HKST-UBA03]
MIRLGEIDFINALPFKLSQEEAEFAEAQVVRASPKQLNQWLCEGRLDVSAISSACYLAHRHELTLIDGLSISAQRPVKSVLLFLPTDRQAITTPTTKHPATLFIPDTSETSVLLARYILEQPEHQWPIPYQLQVYQRGLARMTLTQATETGAAVLAIGDEALMLDGWQHPGYKVIDLAQAWHETKASPFVFGVWAVRNDWLAQDPKGNRARLNRLCGLLRHKKYHFQSDKVYQQALVDSLLTRYQTDGSPDTEQQQQQQQQQQARLHHYLTHALTYNLDLPHRMGLDEFDQTITCLNKHVTTVSDSTGTEAVMPPAGQSPTNHINQKKAQEEAYAPLA